MTSGTDELNDKTRKKIKKVKMKGVTTWGLNNVSPWFKPPTATREFHDFDTSKTLKFNKNEKIRITQVI